MPPIEDGAQAIQKTRHAQQEWAQQWNASQILSWSTWAECFVCENRKNSLQVRRDRPELLHSCNEGDFDNSPYYDDYDDDDDESRSSNLEEICVDG